MMRDGPIVNYYCYFEIKIDSGFDSEDWVEYSMGAIPARIAHNIGRLTSYLLLFFLVNNVFYQLDDVVFISSNGVAWQVKEIESELYLVTNYGSLLIGVFDQISMPNLSYALINNNEISITRIKIIEKLHFDSLKNMYEPNFDLTK